MSEKPNVVLVHGAWADESCWSAVIESLQAAGFTVTAQRMGTQTVEVPSSHLAMVSHPAEVVRLIEAAANRPASIV